MNRRNFLKGIYGLLALIPFISIESKSKPIIYGVDKAIPESEIEAVLRLDKYARAMGITFWYGPSSHINCKCKLIQEGEIIKRPNERL